jgi:diguanylate cyclase (GGDEF)-like protein
VNLDVDFIPGGLVLMDPDGRVTAVNRTLCTWLGRAGEELQGQSPEVWMTTASRMYYLAHVLPSLRLHGSIEEVFLTLTSQHGKGLPVLMSASHSGSPAEGFWMLFMPVQRRSLVEEELQQARKAAEQALEEKDRALQEMQAMALELERGHRELESLNAQLEQLATQDALTGLDNRRIYDREIEIHLALFQRARLPFSLVLADIDWFKDFNDRYGHEAGDRVLQDVSRCLASGMRDIDTLVRMGGEEFAFILPDTTAKNAALVAERKRRDIEQLDTPYGRVTLSFGVTEVHPGDTRGELYGRADLCLYQAKSDGRNRVHVG